MRTHHYLLTGVLIAVLQAGTTLGASKTGINVVPLPEKIQLGDGAFVITDKTTLYANDDARPVAAYLSDLLTPALGCKLEVKAASQSPADGITLLVQKDRKELGTEGYELKASRTGVTIVAAAPAGTFYGCQTLRQLLPVEIESGQKVSAPLQVPAVEILDRPRFAWRGLLLDEGRHFFGKEFAKRYIDYLAMHKMNRLHWHLTEDQGWRIEIKKYPKLTEVGSWREQTNGDGKRYGGFYTQDDIREVVAYATSRYITVVPEIEMPGHSLGALTAYPELSCTGGPFKVRTKWGVEDDVYCAGNDKTFAFLQDVLDEVMTLFPSEYIHIGGDECPKKRWQKCPRCQARIKAENLKDEHHLQSYFIQRIEKYLNSKGRKIIGWDEILEGGLAPNATVMSWRGMGGATAAAKSSHNYIATPTSHCYLDYSYGSISLEKAYSFDPIPAALSEDQHKYCMGVQGNIWTEHTPTSADVDRQTWPRLIALAEVGWTPSKSRDYADFLARLEVLSKRMTARGLPLRLPGLTVGTWSPAQMSATFKTLEWDITPLIRSAGNFEVEFSYTKGKCGIAVEWATILEDGKEIARDKHECFAGGKSRDNIYKLTVPSLKAGAKYTLQASLRSDGGTDSSGVVRIKQQ